MKIQKLIFQKFGLIIVLLSAGNMLILNTCSFQKKMLSNLMSVVIYSLTKCVLEDGLKSSCILKILQNLQKYITYGVYC